MLSMTLPSKLPGIFSKQICQLGEHRGGLEGGRVEEELVDNAWNGYRAKCTISSENSPLYLITTWGGESKSSVMTSICKREKVLDQRRTKAVWKRHGKHGSKTLTKQV